MYGYFHRKRPRTSYCSQSLVCLERKHQIDILETINGIESKSSMSTAEIRKKAISIIHQHYPEQEWVKLYTDGSATDAVKNGGGGVFIEWPNGSTTLQAFPAGATYLNYKAEAEALSVALNLINLFRNTKMTKFALLSDAKSVLQAPVFSQGQPTAGRSCKHLL